MKPAVLIMLLAAHVSLCADPLDNWTWRNPLPTGNRLTAVTHGDGRFVAVGEAGTIAVSTDATHWLVRQTPAGTLSSVAYGNNRFVAVGGSIPAPCWIVVSANGTNWSSASPATTNGLYAVTFGGGLFVAVGENETIVTSTDGTNWIKRHETPLSGRFVDVAYGNGLFMVANNNAGAVFTSTDGVNWSPRPAFGSGFRRLSFSNGVFLTENLFYVGGGGLASRLATSADGNSWITSPLPPPASASFIHDSTRFVLVGLDINSQSNVVFTSANGLNWTTTNFIEALPNKQLHDLAFGGGQYVGVSGVIVRSSDSLQWPVVGSSLPISSARVFLSGNGRQVLAGSGPILTSTNGIDYETNAPVGTFGAGTFGTNTFILTSGGGAIVTSTNGSNWLSRNTGGSSINALTYGSNQFVAVGNAGDVRTSSNGITWTGRFSGTSLHLNAVAYGNGLFVAAGQTGAILTSPDGVSWTFQDSGTTASFDAIAFGNGIFFVAGRKGTGTQIHISSDGVNWTPTYSDSFGSSTAATAVRGNLIVVSSSDTISASPLVLRSLDGIHWQSYRAPFWGSALCGTTDKTLVLLGLNSTVVESGELSPVGLFSSAHHWSNGFSLKATGDIGTTGRLQKSTNLIHWTDVLTFSNVPPWTPLTDPGATNSPFGYYRVITP